MYSDKRLIAGVYLLTSLFDQEFQLLWQTLWCEILEGSPLQYVLPYYTRYIELKCDVRFCLLGKASIVTLCLKKRSRSISEPP